MYPDCQSALKPVVHDTDYPVPIAPSSDAMNNEESDTEDNDSDIGVMECTYDPNSDIKSHIWSAKPNWTICFRDLSL